MITYGRKTSKRHATDQDTPRQQSSRPRKRTKTTVETAQNPSPKGKQRALPDNPGSATKISPTQSHGSRRHNSTLTDHDTDTDEPSPSSKRPQTPPAGDRSSSPPYTPKRTPKVTYLSRTPSHSNITQSPKSKPLAAQPTILAGSSQPLSGGSSSGDFLTPRKPARDLSGLFDFTPSKSVTKSTGKHGDKSATSGSGIAKRMLSRSRTESSFESGSQSQSQSLASLSSSLSQASLAAKGDAGTSRSPSPFKQTPSLPPPSAPVSLPAPSTAHTRTYAGKSRSFLISLPASSIADPSGSNLGLGVEDPIAEESEARESYTDLRTRWGIDNSEDDPYPNIDNSQSPTDSGSQSPNKGKAKQVVTYANGMTNDLKSITELRSKGESRRFLDEVGYLFEGLEPNGGVGVRRASALEIVTKLCSPEFARKAKAADFYTRAWDVLLAAGAAIDPPTSTSAQHDKILSIILAFFSALVACDSGSLAELAERPERRHGISEVAESLTAILGSSISDREKDGLALVGAGVSDTELRAVGVARTEKPLLSTIYSTISKKSGIFPTTTYISTRLLVSQSLAALPSKLIDTHSISIIIGTLRTELALVPPRVNAYISGLALLPPESPASLSAQPSFEHIENCLKLLDSWLLGQSVDDGSDKRDVLQDHWNQGFANELVALSIVTELLADSPEDQHRHAIAVKCTEITLRVLLSLTRDDADAKWCQELLDDDLLLPYIMRTIMKSHDQRLVILSDNKRLVEEDDNEAKILDRLCLSLGLLTNLVQASHSAKDQTRKSRIDPNCRGKRACIQACHCPQHVSALECLVQVYVQQGKDTDADPGAIFLRGHVAVLLGIVMRDNKANQRVLLGVLPGSSKQSKLHSLAAQAREFVVFYAGLTARLSAAATVKDEDDDEDDEVKPDDNVERVVRDGNSQVAKDVVSFLEELSTRH